MEPDDWRTGPRIARNTNYAWNRRIIYDDEDNVPMMDDLIDWMERSEEPYEQPEKPSI